MSCILTFSGVGYPFFKWFSYTNFRDSESTTKVANWNPKNNGYALHVASCVVEWIACLSLAIYAASFYEEFHSLSVEVCYVKNDRMKREKNGDYTRVKQNTDKE